MCPFFAHTATVQAGWTQRAQSETEHAEGGWSFLTGVGHTNNNSSVVSLPLCGLCVLLRLTAARQGGGGAGIDAGQQRVARDVGPFPAKRRTDPHVEAATVKCGAA